MYHKQKLVPFGEFVPLEDAIRGLIPFFDLPLSSFSRGQPDQKILTAKGRTLAPFICYEIVYPELVRTLGNDADYLLTISNDAWFGRSWGPHQHLEMVRMRALEMGKYTLRGTNTGITALIDHKGDIQATIPQFRAGTLSGEIYMTEGRTPYSLWGHRPLLVLCGLIIIGFGLFEWRQKKPTKAPTPPTIKPQI